MRAYPAILTMWLGVIGGEPYRPSHPHTIWLSLLLWFLYHHVGWMGAQPTTFPPAGLGPMNIIIVIVITIIMAIANIRVVRFGWRGRVVRADPAIPHPPWLGGWVSDRTIHHRAL